MRIKNFAIAGNRSLGIQRKVNLAGQWKIQGFKEWTYLLCSWICALLLLTFETSRPSTRCRPSSCHTRETFVVILHLLRRLSSRHKKIIERATSAECPRISSNVQSFGGEKGGERIKNTNLSCVKKRARVNKSVQIKWNVIYNLRNDAGNNAWRKLLCFIIKYN